MLKYINFSENSDNKKIYFNSGKYIHYWKLIYISVLITITGMISMETMIKVCLPAKAVERIRTLAKNNQGFEDENDVIIHAVTDLLERHENEKA